MFAGDKVQVTVYTEQKDIETWITDIQGQWTSKGFDVKLRAEKGIALN